jgi:hypothetical protein
MIPILGVPIVNGFHWLERLVNSIDFPIDKLIIINNNAEDIELTDQLNTLSAKQFDYINYIHICHLPSNIGVASAWNLIIKSSINSPYWLISNHDIAFTPGLLKTFFDRAQQQDIGILYGSNGDFSIGSYDLFLIKDWVIQKLGLFDENFYPAYCEDVDYIMRLHNYNFKNDIIKNEALNIPYYHGNGLSSDNNCYLEHGQQTAKYNNDISNQLNNVHFLNFNYMFQKWGHNWRNLDPQSFPLNVPNMPLSYTSYDLEFCRSKFLNLNNKDNNKDNNMNIFYQDSHPKDENGIIDTNKFEINPSYSPRVFVVDNFYKDPLAIREFALNQKYFPGEGAVGHRTKKQFLFNGLKEKFEQIMGHSIPDHTENGYGWRDIGINGRFQYCEAGTNLVYHCDIQKWAAMIFLTPDAPPSAGTSFFRHKETKIYHNSQIDWDTNGNVVFNQKTFLDKTPYELTDSVSNIFNRLVIFDGGLIHSASDYFGWDINSSRLFHIFFFN